MAKVTLVHQAPGDDQPQELPVFLSDKGKLHMPSVCRMLGLSLIQLDGVLVPQDATYSPATYDSDARIEVSGFQLAAELPNMSAALKAMRASSPRLAEMEPTAFTISLPDDTYLPGDDARKRRALFVRPCYSALFSLILESPAVLIIGTPGIGKSRFLLYVIWRLQQMSTPPSIIWDTPDGRRFLLQQGRAFSGGLNDFETELSCSDAFYLVDARRPYFSGIAARKVVVSSPCRDIYKAYLKSTLATVLYMPLWEEDEFWQLYAEQYAQRLPRAHVDSLVSRYGPVPRYTLEVPSARASLDMKEDLRELEVALRIVNVDQVLRGSLVPEQVPKSNDSLLHITTTGTFEQAYVVTASRFVANRIIAKAKEEGFAKAHFLLQAVKPVDILEGLRAGKRGSLKKAADAIAPPPPDGSCSSSNVAAAATTTRPFAVRPIKPPSRPLTLRRCPSQPLPALMQNASRSVVSTRRSRGLMKLL